jgi:hypothetical protein
MWQEKAPQAFQDRSPEPETGFNVDPLEYRRQIRIWMITNGEYRLFEKPLDSAMLCFYSYENKRNFHKEDHD